MFCSCHLQGKKNFSIFLLILNISIFLIKMIKAILIDLSGTLHVDNLAIPGAVEALKKLRSTNVQIKFVTNTTKESSSFLHNRLVNLGFTIAKDEIYSSLTAAKELIKQKNLKPMLLLAPEAMEDFNDVELKPGEKPNAVVIGLAPSEFHYEKLNTAFRYLLDGAQLIGIHAGRFYKRSDGLALGPGLFVKGLEYAANCQATIVGKPNENFFISAIGSLHPKECVMIGDDVNDDILGAQKIGMQAILVQTGKYRTGDETKITPSPTFTTRDFAEAVDKIISKLEQTTT